jgi:hypothetical protein
MHAARNSDGSRLIDVALGGIAPIVVAAALVAIRGEVRNTSVAVLLAVVVVATGTLGGRSAGLVTGLTAAASYDFFHTRPYLSLHVRDTGDLGVTILLLALGLVSGLRRWNTGVAAGRRTGDGAGPDHIRLRLDRLASGAGGRGVIALGRCALIDVFQLVDCQFEPAPFADRLDVAHLERDGVVGHRRYRLLPDGELEVELPAEGIALPVRSGGEVLGRFVLDFGPSAGASLEQRIVAIAVADQVGAALAATHPGAGALRRRIAAPNSAADTDPARMPTLACACSAGSA